MNLPRQRQLVTAAASGIIALPALAGITCPNEFETSTSMLVPMYAYFGGVISWGTNWSNTTIHSGHSCEVWANLVNDQFTSAGFAVGAFAIAPPALAPSASANTFSVTIQAPASGSMSVQVFLREDDNNDGVININGQDDEWRSPVIMLLPGTRAYNIPYAQFADNNSEGNGVRNFNTTGRLGLALEFVTRDSYPGGQIVGPVSLLIDHCGLYAGAQTVGRPGDVNHDGLVNVSDLLAVIGAWGACPPQPAACPADVAPLPSGDGVVNVTDLLMVIANWG